MKTYYKMPISFKSLIKGEKHEVCDMKDSIKQHIHLIIGTHTVDYRFDEEYGCLIWNKDFLNIKSLSKWRDETEALVLQAIKTAEKRLVSVKVVMRIDEPIVDKKNGIEARLRRKIIIQINGIILKTNEPISHTEYVFFSPLSLS